MRRNNRIMIIAGEASGDLHGANLVLAARRLAPELNFFGMGGERLKAAGVELVFDLEHMALMGVSEVFTGLRKVLATLRVLKRSIYEEKPAALVLIDYPDFNLVLAKAAKKAGVPVFYYICPQIWAWRRGRIRKMAQLVDRRVVVFPFEVDFYRNHGLAADFVGHPLLDVMSSPRPKPEVKAELGFAPDRPLVVLMPGSRKHLVSRLLPVMLQAVRLVRDVHPAAQIALAQADTINESFLSEFLEHGNDFRIIKSQSHLLQNAADAAIVASGTATVETALMLTPMVVVYRMGWLNHLLARLLIQTEHIAMSNLIADYRVVPELIQQEASPERLSEEIVKILEIGNVREEMLAGLSRVRERLGGPGASQRAAQLLLDTMEGGTIPS